MHQTFYIDIDEEITSVVERLKKSRTGEIIMVVPKRALLIQSIVNLRILKREADESGLQLMMVTQDKLGKILIEKAGIFVQQKMDNLSDEEIDLREEENKIAENNQISDDKIEEFGKSDGRLNEIGSESYFSELEKEKTEEREADKIKKTNLKNKKSKKENLINMELVTEIGKDIKKEKTKVQMDVQVGKTGAVSSADLRREFSPNLSQSVRNSAESNYVNSQDKKIEDFFYHSGSFEEKRKKPEKKDLRDFNVSPKMHKRFWIFGSILLIIALGITAYLFIPKTKVVISAKTNMKSIDSEVTGDVNLKTVDYEKGVIPARLVVVEGEISKSVASSGSKAVSNQKARGMITIYNEYDSNPQSLVATTRFLAEDGKLFRLVSATTIPGMSKVDNQMKPGSVEAQVVADQPGEEYNIGPSKFKIPGFEKSGGNKYDKFYASSEKAMTGGGNGTGESKFVTAEDISSAKIKALAEAEEMIKQKIKNSAGEEAVLIDGAIKKEEAVYKLSNSQNDVVDSFQVTIQAKASALVFSQKDLNEVVAKMIAKAGNVEGGVNIDSLAFDFGKPNVDFEKGTLDIKFHASGKLNPNLNLDTIKKEILGKNEENLKAYLSTFSDIEKVEVEYWPSFINDRIPFRSGQVDLSLDNK